MLPVIIAFLAEEALAILISIIISISLTAAIGIILTYWDDIVIFFKGKKIAVLGERGTGKTSLLTFLSTGTMLPLNYSKQTAREKISKKRLKLHNNIKSLDLCIKETTDIGGSQYYYKEWEELFNDSEIIIYLLRSDYIMANTIEDLVKVEIDTIEKMNNTKSRINRDLSHLSDWINEAKKQKAKKSIFIVGSFCDNDKNYNESIKHKKESIYFDRFYKLQSISNFLFQAGGRDEIKIVLGSLEKLQTTELLVVNIFREAIGK